MVTKQVKGFPGDANDKEPPANAGNVRDEGWSLGREDPWRRKWQPLQSSGLENLMDRGAWWATVHGVTESRTWLKLLSTFEDKGWEG